MTYKTCFFLLCLVLLSPIFSPAQGQTVKDDLGFSHMLSKPPQRIISLAPNITEILYALGLKEKIIGVTRYCDFPPETREKVKVGGLMDPNLEIIKALDPDLIISFRGNPLSVIQRLRDLNFPVFVVDTGSTLEAVFRTIERVGTVTWKKNEAEALTRELRRRYETVREALRDAKKRPRVFLALDSSDLWTCGQGSFLDDLITQAEAENIAGGIPRRWLRLQKEQLVMEDPEVILVMAPSLQDFERIRGFLSREPYLAEVQAIKTGNVFYLDENLASRLGPRLFDAFSKVARLLHPEQFETKNKGSLNPKSRQS